MPSPLRMTAARRPARLGPAPLLLPLFLAASCGTQGAAAPQPPADDLPAIAALLTGVEAVGVGGAGLLSGDPSSPDLHLAQHRAGASVRLRFTCAACDLRVLAQGQVVGPNQDLVLAFPDLSPASDVAIRVIDRVSGRQARYRLAATPPDLPAYAVQVTGPVEPGDLYVAPFSSAGTALPASWLLAIGPDGALRHYLRAPASQPFADFKKTVLPGGAVRYSYFEFGSNLLRVLDADLRLVDTVGPRPFPDGRTYPVDLHDVVILGERHYLVGVLAIHPVAGIPGHPETTSVAAAGLQELVDGEPVWSWLSSDHPELYACSTDGNDFSRPAADYVHWNAVAVDGDGDLLASFRHLDAVLKIGRTDGTLRWILGGPCDQFGLAPAQRFSHQHYARRLPDGRLGVFDNNNAGGASRAMFLHLDEATRTLVADDPALPAVATVAPGPRFSFAMGSAQRLPGGHLLLGWGAHRDGLPDVTELDAATGAPTFQLSFGPDPTGAPTWSYRAMKFP